MAWNRNTYHIRPLCVKVILGEKAMQHILNRHPEMTDNIDHMSYAIQYPDEIIMQRAGKRRAYIILKRVSTMRYGEKFLVVICEALNEGSAKVKTAYKTSNPLKLYKRGRIIWPR